MAVKTTFKGLVPADDPMFTGRYEVFSSKSNGAMGPVGQEPLPAEVIQVVAIHSADYWVKVVDFLQQNWALINDETDGRVRIHFINDRSGVFDELTFSSVDEARDALIGNRFQKFSDSPDLQSFLHPPLAPFHQTSHPNGPIYSSGRFWK